ncbi:MAG: tRNA uridine-5-carboxymethylaminomethyl(34) synthesis GTPase MnmE [Spirochaetaceae bacterium]
MIQSAKDDPIVALATPPGRSAIALIRGSGAGCLYLLASRFSRPQAIAAAAGHSVLVGHFHDGDPAATLDQVTITVYRGPKSYTGEDSFEIGSHGNPGGVQRILEALIRAGFRMAEPGEFTLRAFLAGKMDLTQAEAVHELVMARTDKGRSLALERLEGSVRRRIEAIKDELAALMVQVNVQLDYGEDEVEELPIEGSRLESVLTTIQELLAGYRRGRLYQEGATVVLAGPPNVGKSSLFNALLREERALTDPTPGTTRDYLEVALDIRGIPVRLFDTAGLRESDEGVEQRGIEHTNRLVHGADLVIRVLDARKAELDAPTAPAASGEMQSRATEVIVYNKADLLSSADSEVLALALAKTDGALLLSATTHEGIDALEDVLASALLGADQTAGTVIDSPRQKALLEEAADALEEARRGLSAGATIDLVAEDLQVALSALGQITGEVTTADLLERMFSSFCLGK